MVNRLTPLNAAYLLSLETYIQAGWESMSVCALVELSSSRFSRLRERVAENPRTPITILARLASDRCPDVRLAIAENVNAPAGLLNILADDDDPDVRYGLAENSRLPAGILERLANDSNPYVACRASWTLARMRQLQNLWAA
jgi:hypothetical protein